MGQEANDEAHLRKYLLGVLNEAEQQAIEERLMADAALFDLLHVAEDELIDDYLEPGLLSTDERGRFENFFLLIPDRQRKLNFAMALKRYVTADGAPAEALAGRKDVAVVQGPSRWFARAAASPYLRAAAAAVILIGLGFGIWRLVLNKSEVSKGIASLARAYSKERPLESRISALDYAPFLETRGPEEIKVDAVARNRAERILLDEVDERPSPAAHHALGEFYLTQRRFDEAIKQFEEASQGDPDNARLHSDFGAALLEKGKAGRSTDGSGRSLEYFARSLEHLSRALELSPTLHEALFNRALCYEHLSLPDQAEADWQRYIEIDSNSSWADEARRKLKELADRKIKTAESREQLLRDFLDAYDTRDDEKAWHAFSSARFRSANFISERLLGDYLESASKGRTDEAGKQLQTLEYAGSVETERAGDHFTSDLARFYASRSRNDLVDLVEARQLMKAAQDFDSQSRIQRAVGLYEKARRILEKQGADCEAQYVSYRISQCYLRQPDIKSSLATLDPLLAECGQKNYLWLQARVFNGLSHAHESLSEYSKALQYSRMAMELSQRIGDQNGVVRSLIQMASEYRSIGDFGKSLSSLQRGLFMANDSSPETSQVWIIYDVAAQNFTSLNLYSTAIAYQLETLRLAEEMRTPLNLSRGYAHLGTIYGKLNNYAEAIKSMQQSFEIGEPLGDESVGLDIMAYSALRLGHLYRQSGDFNKALEYYDRTIELYSNVAFEAESYEAHKGKLFCNLALQNDSAVSAELAVALKLIEQYRYKILEESSRNAFFDNEQDIFDLAVGFEYTKMDNERKAFDYSEASRARSLLDLYSPTARILKQSYGPDVLLPSVVNPLKLAELQPRLPDQVQILQYAALADRVVIWVVSRNSFLSSQAKIDIGQLDTTVRDYLDAIAGATRNDGSEQTSQARILYDILIKPVEQSLDKKKHLCIVPDKILNYVPFAAIVCPATGDYLIKDFVIELAPSATLFVNCSDVARAKSGSTREAILSVGNPAFDREQFSSLRELPQSANEAATAASFYDSSRCLIGTNAREEQVKSRIAEADVIHFATHFVVDQRSPMLSGLLLTKEEAETRESQSDGNLQAYEICDMRLPRARLVVLSACQTGIERVYRGEGAIGAVRPFMKAGAPLVVASLWPVDSSSAAELMIALHKHRKREGASSAKALRLSQLEMLDSPDARLHQPLYWASFIIVGGYATF